MDIYPIIGESFNTTINYAYDSIGNILDKSDVGLYEYQNAHQVSVAGSHTYTYDLNGNVIQKDS